MMIAAVLRNPPSTVKRTKRTCISRCCKRSLTDSTTLSGKDYSRNDGIIEGVWIFIRHGDRTPGRSLSAKQWRCQEAAYWIQKLPNPNTGLVYQHLSSYFPVQQLGASPQEFIDVARNPFGFLTAKGLSSLRSSGRRFAQRYNQKFLSPRDTHIYATNYLRTVLSVQSFMSGLLGVPECPAGDVEDERTTCDATTKETFPGESDHFRKHNEVLFPVMVRELEKDPLNAFDRHPELVAALSAEVMTSDEFILGDGSAAPLAARLANILPGLVKPRGAGDYASQSPSGINWVEAADHFVCRSAHGIPLSRFSEHENDDHIEQTLHALSHPTLAHLAWRFRQWYSNEKLLAEIAAPPLREVADQIAETTRLGRDEPHPFVVYSCHDITILGLLYGIRADFLEEENGGKGINRFWPPYGSHLVFELVRIGPESTEGPSHIVRVLLNGASLIFLSLISHFCNSRRTSTECGPQSATPERACWIELYDEII